jgi:hypothetical protein
MKMTVISTSTLANISQHKDKLIRLSSYLLETGSPYMVNKMAEVVERDGAGDVLLALESDLNGTVKLVESMSKIMGFVGADDICIELDNDVKDISKLFPEHYKNGSLNVFGVKLHKGRAPMLKKDIKEAIFENAFPGESFEEYRKLVTLVKSMSQSSKPTIDEPFETRLIHANQLHSLGKKEGFLIKVLASTDKYFEVRMSMPDKQKMLVDRKIYSGSRAMIDGVTKQSTFINKTDGIMQISSKHKKQSAIIGDIEKMLADMPFVKAVELDQDADPDKLYAMLSQLKDMSFEIDEPFELKVRKIKYLKASGVQSVKTDGSSEIREVFGYTNLTTRIIACDVDAPTSVAHELAHYRDINRGDKTRESIVNLFSSKIDVKALGNLGGKYDASYFFDDMEVIARLAELGYLLNLHGYETGESFDSFFDRVREGELTIDNDDEKLKYHVALAEPLAAYTVSDELMSNVYFNMKDWSPEELSMCKDYTHSFFYKNDPEVAKRLQMNLSKCSLDTKAIIEAKRNRSRYSKSTKQDSKAMERKLAWGFVLPNELGEVYKCAFDNDLLREGEFSSYLGQDHTLLFKEKSSKRSASGKMVEDQYQGFIDVADALNKIDGAEVEKIVLHSVSSRIATKYKSHIMGPEYMAEMAAQDVLFSAITREDGPEVEKRIESISRKGYKLKGNALIHKVPEMLKQAAMSLDEGAKLALESTDLVSLSKGLATHVKALTAARVMIHEFETPTNDIKTLLSKEQIRQVALAVAPDGDMANKLPSLLQQDRFSKVFDAQGLVSDFATDGADERVALSLIEKGVLDDIGLSGASIDDINNALKATLESVDPECELALSNLKQGDDVTLAITDAVKWLGNKEREDTSRKIITVSEEAWGVDDQVSPVSLLAVLAHRLPSDGKSSARVANFVVKAASELRSDGSFEKGIESNVTIFSYDSMPKGHEPSDVLKSMAGDARGQFIDSLIVSRKKEEDTSFIQTKPTELLLELMVGQVASHYLSLAIAEVPGVHNKVAIPTKGRAKEIALASGTTYQHSSIDAGVSILTAIAGKVTAFKSEVERMKMDTFPEYESSKAHLDNLIEMSSDTLNKVRDISPNMFFGLSEIMVGCTPSADYGIYKEEHTQGLDKIKDIWYNVAAVFSEEGFYASPAVWEDSLDRDSVPTITLSPAVSCEIEKIQLKVIDELNKDIKPALDGEILNKDHQMRMF